MITNGLNTVFLMLRHSHPKNTFTFETHTNTIRKFFNKTAVCSAVHFK